MIVFNSGTSVDDVNKDESELPYLCWMQAA